MSQHNQIYLLQFSFLIPLAKVSLCSLTSYNVSNARLCIVYYCMNGGTQSKYMSHPVTLSLVVCLHSLINGAEHFQTHIILNLLHIEVLS